MTTQLLLAAVSLLLGFVIGQANRYFERKYEQKRLIRRALSEMLEIRHRYKRSVYFLGQLKEVIKSPDNLGKALANFPPELLWDERLSVRLDDVVSKIAEHLPIVAFALRSKDMPNSLNSKQLQEIKGSPSGAVFFVTIMKEQEEQLMPEIDSVIEVLSEHCGRKVRKWVKEYLQENAEPPQEVIEWTNKIIGMANDQPMPTDQALNV